MMPPVSALLLLRIASQFVHAHRRADWLQNGPVNSGPLPQCARRLSGVSFSEASPMRSRCFDGLTLLSIPASNLRNPVWRF